LEQANQLCFEVIENEHRTYRGPRKTYFCAKGVPGGSQPQTVVLAAIDFIDSADGTPLKSWAHLDQLGIGMRRPAAPKMQSGKQSAVERLPPRPWRGPDPEFVRLEWR
jgi:hypothetical protein